MIKLACADAIAPGSTWTEKAHNLRKLGFQGLSVFTTREQFTDGKLQELMRLKCETGIEPIEFVFTDGYYGHLMDRNPEVRKKALAVYEESIDICGQIGALTEMEYEYRMQDEIPLFEPYPTIPEEDAQELAEKMKYLCKRGEKKGVQLLLEPCNRYECRYLKTLGEASDFIQRVGHVNAGILADIFHLSIEESSVPVAIQAAGEKIKHFHLGDNNRLLPGQGSIAWEEILNAAVKVGFNGYYSLECGIRGDVETELSRFVRYFTKLWSFASLKAC